MSLDNHNATPGMGPVQETAHRQVLLGNEQFLPGNHVLDGAKARDLGGSTITELRPGLLLGVVTASKKLGASIIGASGVLHDTSAVTTVMTLPAAIVTEITRRIGASGTFKITGPPTASGTVVTEVVTYSAIASSTTLTITATSADFAAGSFIQPNDGSETIKTFLADGYPIKAVDTNAVDRDIQPGRYPIAGLIDSSQLIDWPSDTSLRQWIVDALNAVGQFTFDHKHGQ